MVATLLSAPLVLQAPPSPISVLGTVGLLALFLSITAHLAARNVLGDVSPTKALGVGAAPAAVSVATPLLSLPGVAGIFAAIVVDGVAIKLVYDQPRRVTLSLLAVHAIVSVLLGTVLFGGLILLSTVPG